MWIGPAFSGATFRCSVFILQLKKLRLKLVVSVFSVRSWELSGKCMCGSRYQVPPGRLAQGQAATSGRAGIHATQLH